MTQHPGESCERGRCTRKPADRAIEVIRLAGMGRDEALIPGNTCCYHAYLDAPRLTVIPTDVNCEAVNALNARPAPSAVVM